MKEFENGDSCAFPYFSDCSRGLTKRQYYAAKAMQALIPLWMDRGITFSDKVGSQAWEYADKLIETEKDYEKER